MDKPKGKKAIIMYVFELKELNIYYHNNLYISLV